MKNGRPTKYKKEYDIQAAKLCALGATTPILADFFGVSVSTVKLWMVEHASFSASVKLSKEKANSIVKRSLLERAVGYEHDDVDIKVINNEIVKTPIRKYYPPDTRAISLWLRNRDPENWSDRVQIDHSMDSIEKSLDELAHRLPD